MTREREGWERPLYWTADGERAPLRPLRAARARAAGHARLVVRGGRLRPLARRAAAHRGRVGARRHRARLQARSARPARLRARPRRPVRGRLLGVDRHRVRRLPGLRGLPLPRVLGDLLRPAATACCAAAPGPPARAWRAQTFRNWDHPERRQIFAGFRCAVDATAPSAERTSIDRLSTGLDTLVDDVRDGLTRRRSRSCRPSTSTTSADPSCSTGSRRCPSTTRRAASAQILNRHSPEIVEASDAEELVELGSGTASKTRALLYAMAGNGLAAALRAVRLSTRRWSRPAPRS